MKCCRGFVYVLFLFVAQASYSQDVSGSADHPLITRFPDSVISWYERQSFEPYRIAVGPVTGYRTIDEWLDVEGKLTRINYTLKGDRGLYEVYSNYLNAAKRAGFDILAEGFSKSSSRKGEIGHRGFLEVHYGANEIPPGKSLLLRGSATSAGSGFVVARLARPEGDVYLVVATTQQKQDEIVALVDIIEVRPPEDNLIMIDAAAMSKEIDIYGKVALYGLHFDHDKTTIKAESKPALDEIAKLLSTRSNLNVYVVGHTDSTGSLDYNLRLSKGRAQAVVDALIRDYAIAPERLDGQGVGPLVPVATNTADPGKAKNRRVELVEK